LLEFGLAGRRFPVIRLLNNQFERGLRHSRSANNAGVSVRCAGRQEERTCRDCYHAFRRRLTLSGDPGDHRHVFQCFQSRSADVDSCVKGHGCISHRDCGLYTLQAGLARHQRADWTLCKLPNVRQRCWTLLSQWHVHDLRWEMLGSLLSSLAQV
jgi:hypothetical protein